MAALYLAHALSLGMLLGLLKKSGLIRPPEKGQTLCMNNLTWTGCLQFDNTIVATGCQEARISRTPRHGVTSGLVTLQLCDYVSAVLVPDVHISICYYGSVSPGASSRWGQYVLTFRATDNKILICAAQVASNEEFAATVAFVLLHARPTGDIIDPSLTIL